MILKTEFYNNFYQINQNYNNDIRAFVGSLFQTNNTGRIKYIVSVLDNFHATKRHQYYYQDSKEYKRPQDDNSILRNFEKFPGMGPLEFSLATYLLKKEMGTDVLILTGALGSGKSCISNYVLDYIENLNFLNSDILHFPSTGLIIRIDFNDVNDGSTQDVTSQFKKILINKLLGHIEQIHRTDMFIKKFIEEVESRNDSRFLEFWEFAWKLNREENRPTEKSKFDFLLSWLHDYDDDLSYKLRLISYLFAFIKTYKSSQNIDMIFLFDNIDNFHDQAQVEILSIIFSFSNKLKNIRILVPMRLTTFGKIKGQGSYSFAIVQNTGQPPALILEKRISHLLESVKEYKLDEIISKQVLPDFLIKINTFIKFFNDKSEYNRLVNFFSAIAGNSIRRGLYAAERFFVNSAIVYNETNLLQDDFLKALLISENVSSKMENTDRLVNNIFAGVGNKNTLLNIRILQIVIALKERNFICTISIILNQISKFEEYLEEDVLHAINGLIHYPRRLLYIEGVKEYNEYHHLVQSVNDIVQITYSGTLYLETLLYNAVYLQNTFLVLNWEIPKALRNFNYLRIYIEKMKLTSANKDILYLSNLIDNKKATIKDFISETYHFGNVGSRMKLIRECLYFLMLSDLSQLAKYYDNNIEDIEMLEDRYIKSSVFIDMIAKVSFSVFYILRANYSVDKDELEYWYNQLLIVDLWQTNFFKTKNDNLTHSINIFSREFEQH